MGPSLLDNIRNKVEDSLYSWLGSFIIWSSKMLGVGMAGWFFALGMEMILKSRTATFKTALPFMLVFGYIRLLGKD